MACGLSRMLYGKVIPSERPEHFMMEQWNPLGKKKNLFYFI
jgi:aldehyde dehydrogenase family 7 member A1